MKTFGSDNFSSVDERILNYLQKINRQGHAPAYANDDVTREAAELFKQTFGDNVDILFVPTGTGANILSLKLLQQRPYEAVVTSKGSHIFADESGAPAASIGMHVFTVPHTKGKISIDDLKQEIGEHEAMGFHSALPKIVSISNTTECGAIYSAEETRAIADFCHAKDMYLHVDGCRLANAAVAQGVELRALAGDAGVDILSFGGAKNGLMSAEAIVIFNAPESDLRCMQKQAMQLPSKMRFTSGQFVPYLRDGLWKENAEHANNLAKLLKDTLQKRLGDAVQFTQPLETNQLFCIIPTETAQKLRDAGHTFYDWLTPGEVRFVTSWDNTEEDILALEKII